jgi:hypothetical protein
MSTFVAIQPDAFNSAFYATTEVQRNKKTWEETPDNVISRFHSVRRPVRGLQIKEDTYATIQVRDAAGQAIPLFDAASYNREGMGIRNSNFLIQSIQEQRAEKQQIVLTFGEPYIFFFGEQPRILNIEGVLLNTEDFNWRAEWWANYDLYLRGTQCVRSRTRVYLSWDDIVVQGYIISSNSSESSQNQNFVTFQFQMFLTNYENISALGDPYAHLIGKGLELDPSSLEKGGFLEDGQALDMNYFNPDNLYGQLSKGQTTLTAVRRENIVAGKDLEGGVGKNSMLTNLRNGAVFDAMQQGVNRLVEIQGQVVDILAEAGRFIYGRNIRVPLGFEGSAVYDDAQVALASMPGADAVLTGEEGSTRSTVKLAGKTFTIEGERGIRTMTSRYGGLFLNVDEFIARISQDAPGPVVVPELYPFQQGDAVEMDRRVREVFAAFGIDTDPPKEVNLAAKKLAFGIFSVAAGAGLNALNEESGTARFLTNLL